MTDKTKARRVAEAAREVLRISDRDHVAWRALRDALALPDDPPGDAGLLRELHKRMHAEICGMTHRFPGSLQGWAQCLEFMDEQIRLLAAAPADKPAETAPTSRTITGVCTHVEPPGLIWDDIEPEPDAGTTADERERRIAWLIERVAQPTAWLGVPLGCHGRPTWTTASDALRFVRKEDAERVATALGLKPGVFTVTEHLWVDSLRCDSDATRRIADSGGWHSRSETRKGILTALSDDLDTPDDELLDAVAVMVDDATRRAERAEAEVERLTRERDTARKVAIDADEAAERLTKERNEALERGDLKERAAAQRSQWYLDEVARREKAEAELAERLEQVSIRGSLGLMVGDVPGHVRDLRTELDRERGGWAALERLRDYVITENRMIDRGSFGWSYEEHTSPANIVGAIDKALASRPAQGKEGA